jgi:segregation and condensation protein A
VKPGQEYNVRIDVFEGPLDLLLYLVSKAEVDIAQIQVSEVARQYMEYIEVMQDLNLEVASEYLSMAATLTRLKAREILGVEDEMAAGELDGEDICTKQQLIEKLLEYKKYKEAAGSLRIHESERFGSFPRGKSEEMEIGSEEQQVALESLSIFDLISVFRRILERAGKEGANTRTVAPDTVRLDDRIERVLDVLHEGGEVLFEKLFEDDMRKLVLVVTFMAILELVRMHKISFRQEKVFGQIFVRGMSEAEQQEMAGPVQAISETARETTGETVPDGQQPQ